jgi:hypothetical protein
MIGGDSVFCVVRAEKLSRRQLGRADKQKSYKLMKMQMFAALDKANPHTGNERLKLGDGQA